MFVVAGTRDDLQVNSLTDLPRLGAISDLFPRALIPLFPQTIGSCNCLPQVALRSRMAAEPPIEYRKPEELEVAGECARQKSRQRQGCLLYTSPSPRDS